MKNIYLKDMNYSDKIKNLTQSFQRFTSNENQLLALSGEGIALLAQRKEGIWYHQASDYDDIVGISSVLDVDVNKKSQFDTDAVLKELLEAMKKSAYEDMQIDFETSSEFCVKKIEPASVAVLKQDSDEMAVIQSILSEIINRWLAAPIARFFPDLMEKYKSLRTLFFNYLEIKQNFDDYVNAIFPLYKQVVLSQKVESQEAQNRQQTFISNLDYLKNMTVKEARQNINQKPKISEEKINQLMAKKCDSLSEVLSILNK